MRFRIVAFGFVLCWFASFGAWVPGFAECRCFGIFDLGIFGYFGKSDGDSVPAAPSRKPKPLTLNPKPEVCLGLGYSVRVSIREAMWDFGLCLFDCVL